MNTYTIIEKENANSIRQGYEFTGSLTQAKKQATKSQMFHDTFLVIELDDIVFSFKDRNNNKWVNV